MSAQVAVVGSLIDELIDDAVIRCATPQKALDAQAELVVMRDADWVRCRAEAPAHTVCALVTASPGREVYGEYLRDVRVRHVLGEGANLRSELGEMVALITGRAPFTAASLALGERGLSLRLRSSAEEPALLSQATRFVHRVGARGRAAQNWLDALSETVTNAVYNAPRAGDEAPFEGLHRRHAVMLGEHHAVEVNLFASPQDVSFEVADAFGSLTPAHFQRYLGDSLSQAQAKAVEKPGGAGLGLIMMFDRLERLVALVDPGHRTSMVGVGPLSYSQSRERGRTVQFFEGRFQCAAP